MQVLSESVHGGPDARGVPLHDFSTNANACGPCEKLVEALQRVDASHYPDPHYTRLREQLGSFHQVDARRVIVAASSSEFMHRISAFAERIGITRARLPKHAYGDYSRAAQTWGLELANEASNAPVLHWACEPASPLGTVDAALDEWLANPDSTDLRVLDCAYTPLRLDGNAPRRPASAWQVWTPNKALALTGVRAAYVIAPAHAPNAHIDGLRAMAASWPVGAHGVAMLQSWVERDVQQWLHDSLSTLRTWKAAQIARCEALGWQVVEGSLANYFTARLPDACDMNLSLEALREHGIKLRDCTSFGLQQHVRMGVLSPTAQDALVKNWAERSRV